MPQAGGPGWPVTGERVLPDSYELDTPDLFGSDLAHLFDYCRALLGPDAEAIRTARSVLDSAHEPLLDREGLRAWFFGLARSLAVALRPSGAGTLSYLPPAMVAVSNQQDLGGVLGAFRALTDRDREMLDLVYRHGIRPADLPAVLIVPAEEAYRRLLHAEEEFIRLTAGPEADLAVDLEDIAALPLATLPTTEFGDRELADRPARQLEDAARGR